MRTFNTFDVDVELDADLNLLVTPADNGQLDPHRLEYRVSLDELLEDYLYESLYGNDTYGDAINAVWRTLRRLEATRAEAEAGL